MASNRSQKSSEKLIEEQHIIGKAILTQFSSYPGTETREQIPGVYRRLKQLDAYWIQFAKNHENLVESTEVDHSIPYFAEDYFQTILDSVVAYSELIQSTVQKVTGTSPKYDLINRGAYNLNPMFTDDGTLISLEQRPLVIPPYKPPQNVPNQDQDLMSLSNPTSSKSDPTTNPSGARHQW